MTLREGSPTTTQAAQLAAHRPNVVEVDLDAVTANVATMRRLAGPAMTLYAAVKCDGYGLGLPEVAHAALRGGADAFAMTDPTDAIRIREAGIDVPILMYGGLLPEPEVVDLVTRLDLTVTIGDLEAAEAWARLSPGALPVFLKVDIGMERVGVPAEHAAPFVMGALDLPELDVRGLYTHLHGGSGGDYLPWQLDRFDGLLEQLERAGVALPPTILCESSVSLGSPPRPRLNAIDPGHLLYGLLPSGRFTGPDELVPAFVALRSRLLQAKEIHRPGFPDDAPFPPREGMRIGVIPIGRGDGLRHVHCGAVLIRGKRAPVLAVSLEHTRIDLTDVPDATAGDEVVILGRQGSEEISVADAAQQHGVDHVGVLLELHASLPRVYRRGGDRVTPLEAAG